MSKRKGSTYKRNNDLILPISFGILPVILFHMKFLVSANEETLE